MNSKITPLEKAITESFLEQSKQTLKKIGLDIKETEFVHKNQVHVSIFDFFFGLSEYIMEPEKAQAFESFVVYWKNFVREMGYYLEDNHNPFLSFRKLDEGWKEFNKALHSAFILNAKPTDKLRFITALEAIDFLKYLREQNNNEVKALFLNKDTRLLNHCIKQFKPTRMYYSASTDAISKKLFEYAYKMKFFWIEAPKTQMVYIEYASFICFLETMTVKHYL